MSAGEPAIDTKQLIIPPEVADGALAGGLKAHGSLVSSFKGLRVGDLEARYRDRGARGAYVVTAPLDGDAEIRCHTSGPGVYLIEAGQAAVLVEGWLAEQAPAGGEAARSGGR
jgi:hypothetical protein